MTGPLEDLLPGTTFLLYLSERKKKMAETPLHRAAIILTTETAAY